MLALETVVLDNEILLEEEEIVLRYFLNEYFIDYNYINFIILIRLYKKLKEMNFQFICLKNVYMRINKFVQNDFTITYKYFKNDLIIDFLWFVYEKSGKIIHFDKSSHQNGLMYFILKNKFDEFFDRAVIKGENLWD